MTLGWGFAPFHYGRWAHAKTVGWVPGTPSSAPRVRAGLVGGVGGPSASPSASFGRGIVMVPARAA